MAPKHPSQPPSPQKPAAVEASGDMSPAVSAASPPGYRAPPPTTPQSVTSPTSVAAASPPPPNGSLGADVAASIDEPLSRQLPLTTSFYSEPSPAPVGSRLGPDGYIAGSAVEYWSRQGGIWIPAIMEGWDATTCTYTLDVNRRADPNRVRRARAPSQTAPASAVPTTPVLPVAGRGATPTPASTSNPSLIDCSTPLPPGSPNSWGWPQSPEALMQVFGVTDLLGNSKSGSPAGGVTSTAAS
eukprot:gnl/TRDRNA2_/TRDRNA2_150717_c3_seq1.p1 gnl/TRDRNA2_/TRDRNA2_150717_c3~~gnl/TRDRNA2_/TRDRNA2_150717_c3_seq1.p1  ORF type:complete len:273 (-),score=24.98 gnl/TRDRNA2_/TRDRNA2_150717_c3_seq1:76-801(-)